ncbi:N-acetylglucosamine-6-phosphate deacetylase [Acetonema longum]|uniref:N-acetylglucosamine-6-phosphate deacetylase n=1 Tax=Acetonema longum DSM 6540 TaxID=1009370 RepID=F7NNS3_9FIRM|nr:N-acetylglucosamine-6-phosphate deacetylase [Acetonema longum]EGO62257.1 N-acetylglucosamine-6-phosphate deacetylase [Acetonema longum DSM 6540]
MTGLIRNAAIVCPDRVTEPSWCLVQDGRIAALGREGDCSASSFVTETVQKGSAARRDEDYAAPRTERTQASNRRSNDADGPFSTVACDWQVDCEGDWLIPGLIDLHVHGAGGVDTMDARPDSMEKLAATLARLGTTAFLATTMSAPPDAIAAALYSAADYQRHPSSHGAELLGIHMEGPFLATAYKGAQAAAGIYPQGEGAAQQLASLLEAYPGLVRVLTLAVERSDARDLIEICKGQKVIPSVGHSAAEYEVMRQAVAWGLQSVTHAFNAMPAIHHRRPGLLTEALVNPAVHMELIADGVHIHPAVLGVVLGLKPPDKVSIVSDGTRAVGMPNGEYELGGQMTLVRDGVATLPDGTIAGSAFSLLAGVKTLVTTLGYTLPAAVRYASLNPAKLLGVADRLGSIEAGKVANLVRLDRQLTAISVWVKGQAV